MFITATLTIVSSLSMAADFSPQDSSPVHPDWRQQTAFDAGNKLGGCAIGDFDPSRPGNEIAVVTGDGRVIEVFRDGERESGWGHEVLGALPGEPIQCAVGDLLPDRPGLELVTAGVARGVEDDPGPGLAVLWWFTGDSPRAGGSEEQPGISMRWSFAKLFEDGALIHAVAIGDVDPERAGNEVVLAGFSGVVNVVSGLDLATDGSLSIHSEAYTLPGGDSESAVGNVKGAAVGLGGAVLACDDGALLALRKRGTGWALDELARWKDAPLARVMTDADGVLVCSNDGVLRYRQVLRGGAVSSTANAVRREDRLRGAVIADLDPTRPGNEWATAGYDGGVYVVNLTEGVRDEHGLRVIASSDFAVARDDDKFHHLAAGDLPGLGTCLVAVGYSGRVIVVSRVK